MKPPDTLFWLYQLLIWRHKRILQYLLRKFLLPQDRTMRPRLQTDLPFNNTNKARTPFHPREELRDIFDSRGVDEGLVGAGVIYSPISTDFLMGCMD